MSPGSMSSLEASLSPAGQGSAKAVPRSHLVFAKGHATGD